MIIDVVISGGTNVIKKEAEKISKYKGPTVAVQRMWNVKTNVKPVIIGAAGTILKIIQKVPEQHIGKARSRGTR